MNIQLKNIFKIVAHQKSMRSNIKNENLRFDLRPPRVAGVAGVVMGGRRVLEVVGDDRVEDQGLHQVAIAYMNKKTKQQINTLLFNRFFWNHTHQ